MKTKNLIIILSALAAIALLMLATVIAIRYQKANEVQPQVFIGSSEEGRLAWSIDFRRVALAEVKRNPKLKVFEIESNGETTSEVVMVYDGGHTSRLGDLQSYSPDVKAFIFEFENVRYVVGFMNGAPLDSQKVTVTIDNPDETPPTRTIHGVADRGWFLVAVFNTLHLYQFQIGETIVTLRPPIFIPQPVKPQKA